MNKQLSFFETPPAPSFRFNVFLAIFPDHYIAEQIISLGNTLRQIHGLRGRLRPVNHLHVSLFFLGGTTNVPESVAGIIGRVCQAVIAVTNPFEIKFNRVLSFQGRPGNHPLVLVDDNRGNDGVRNLRELISTELIKYFPSPTTPPKFVPHLTLLYNKQALTPKSIEPVSWMVKEIALIRSEVGATKYDWLGRWPLGEHG